MKFLKNLWKDLIIKLWKKVVELVINLLAVMGVIQLIWYKGEYPEGVVDYWLIYLCFIIVVYHTIDVVIKRYNEVFNDGL